MGFTEKLSFMYLYFTTAAPSTAVHSLNTLTWWYTINSFMSYSLFATLIYYVVYSETTAYKVSMFAFGAFSPRHFVTYALAEIIQCISNWIYKRCKQPKQEEVIELTRRLPGLHRRSPDKSSDSSSSARKRKQNGPKKATKPS